MSQVYLEQYEGPLYAYVEFKVGNLTVVNTDEGFATFDASEPYSLDHVTKFESGDTYITNVVMSFSYTKESSVNRGGKSWGIGQEFNISVFDESAVFVEDIISDALGNTSNGANCYIEYGWSANGKKIDERCCSFEGLIQEYTLSFEGSSTILSIVGTTTSVVYMSTTYIESETELPYDVTRNGNPSEIVKYIVDNILNKDGSNMTYKYSNPETGESTIVSTTQVIAHPETNTPRNFSCNNKSITSYIKEDLCPYAKTEDGRCGFIFYIIPDENDPNVSWVHFHPQDSVDNVYSTVDENGDIVVDIGSAGNNEGVATREYNYYAGFQQGEVLSYSSEFKGFAVSAGAKRTSAIDGNTNEMIECDVANIDEGSFVSPSSASRVMGLSSASYQSLDQAMRDLWNKYATQVYGASLDIMGDPNINVMDIINLNVYTKYNLLHHTSGEYLVTSIEDSVDSSGFTTSLTLMKKGALAEFVTQQIQEGDLVGINTAVDKRFQAQPVSGIDYSTDPRFTAPKATSPVVTRDNATPSSMPSKHSESNNASNKVIGKPSTSSSQTIKKVDTPLEGMPSKQGFSNIADPITYKK